MNQPAATRIRIQQQSNRLSIKIPVKKNVRAIVAVLLAAIPWALVLWLLVTRSQLHHTISYAPELYMAAIILWFGTGIAGYTFLSWMFFGRERIVVTPGHMLIEKPLVFYNRRNYYDLSQISDLKIGKEIYKAKESGIWVDRTRTILTFDYPGKQVIFGRGISPEEAEFILLQIAQSNLLPAGSIAATHQV